MSAIYFHVLFQILSTQYLIEQICHIRIVLIMSGNYYPFIYKFYFFLGFFFFSYFSRNALEIIAFLKNIWSVLHSVKIQMFFSIAVIF